MQIQYYFEIIEELEALDQSVQKQIKAKLKEQYRTPFKENGPIALKGPQFKGLYKFRVGDWRLIYKIVDSELHFITLGHRLNVYRD